MASGTRAPIDRTESASHLNSTYDSDGDGVVELAAGVRVFATQADVPSDITQGELVFIANDGSLYVEDGS